LGTVSSVTPTRSCCALRRQVRLASRTTAPVGPPAVLLAPGLADRSILRHPPLFALGHKPPFSAQRLENPRPRHGLAPSLQQLFLRLTWSQTYRQITHLPSSTHLHSLPHPCTEQQNSAHPARHRCRAEQPSPQRTRALVQARSHTLWLEHLRLPPQPPWI